MLEKMPRAVGAALSNVKAGVENTIYYAACRDIPATIRVASEAFADESPLPARVTEDGEGVSPPLSWTDLPPATGSVVLVVEDPDAPMPRPIVHLIAWKLRADAALGEGDLAGPAGPGHPHDLGRNTFQKAAWLPPDPPTGHGPHRYLFQVYAIEGVLDLPDAPGRGDLIDAMKGRVLAKGLLTGTYERA